MIKFLNWLFKMDHSIIIVGFSNFNFIFIVIEISKTDFAFDYVIGRGGFGKVWKVEQKKTH